MPKTALAKTDENAIFLYMMGDIEESGLSHKQKEEVDQMHFCDNLISTYAVRRTVVKMLKKKYTCTDRTAYTIYDKTIYYFGSRGKKDKEYIKHMVVEKLMNLFLKAFKNNDTKAAAILAKEIRESLGYDKDDSNIPDFSKIIIKEPVFMFDASLLGVNLPTDWEKQVESIVRIKKKQVFDDAEDATITE